MKLKADLPKQGIREASLILNAGTVTAVLYGDSLSEEGKWSMIRRSGSQGRCISNSIRGATGGNVGTIKFSGARDCDPLGDVF